MATAGSINLNITMQMIEKVINKAFLTGFIVLLFLSKTIKSTLMGLFPIVTIFRLIDKFAAENQIKVDFW